MSARIALLHLGLMAALAAAISPAAPVAAAAQSNAQSDAEIEALNKRAIELNEAGKFAEAIPLAERFVKAVRERFGENEPKYAMALNNLAELYRSHARHAEAEPLYKRALAIDEKALPKGDPDIADSCNSLALLYSSQGRYTEAEPLYKRALAILEKALPERHPTISKGVNNLAALYQQHQGRYAEAEPLYKRALAIREKALPEGHPDIATSLNNLAALYEARRRYGEAEALHKRALAMREKALPEGHPEIAESLNNLAELHQHQGRFAEAEPLYKRALAMHEKALPEGHPAIATSLNNLALLYKSQGRYMEAEPLYKRALAIREKGLPADHLDLATGLNNLAGLYIAQKEWTQALPYARRATAILISRAALGDPGKDESGREIAQNAYVFRTFLPAASHLNVDDPALRDESFQMAQWAARTQAAGALSQMTARLAAGSGPLADAVRSLQDMQSQWQAADKQLSKALGEGNKTLADSARQQMADLDVRMKQINERLHKDFPRYAELSGARAVSIADAQDALRPDEALVTFTFNADEAYLFVVRKELAKFISLPVKRGEVATLVADLRDSLDAKGRLFIELPPFDVVKAHQLYQKLLGPADAFIRDAAHLIVVPDGPLQSLPPSVLVTEAPKGPISSFGDYREVAWLVRRQAISIVPAASSLVSLRRFAAAGAQARAPFAGFGDPDFSGKRAAEPVKLANLFRGAQESIENVRALPRLADTADELRAEAEALHAPETSVYLGAEATVTKVKSLDLSDTKVVSFATHGLIAGELPKLAEPALAFTPPKEATPDDDGLLRASDVAQLKLNADFVVLSACNTAAADGTVGAEGLSGLAKAFFYAGAKSLLVSHWPVNSAAAVKLTTGTFNALADDPSIGRAQALRRSMLAMIDRTPHSAASAAPDNVLDAHPLFWAPFVLVGEGEGGR